VKNFIAASILSCLIAGVICALTSPVTSAAGVAISVNRDAKGDRLPLLLAVQPSRRDSIKNGKPAPKKAWLAANQLSARSRIRLTRKYSPTARLDADSCRRGRPFPTFAVVLSGARMTLHLGLLQSRG
jgi:hypothetical protein